MWLRSLPFLLIFLYSGFCHSAGSIAVCDQSDTEQFCISLHQTSKSFLNAHLECQSINKTLVTVNSVSKQKFITEIQSKYANSSKSVWIGLYAANNYLKWISSYPAIPQIFVSQPQEHYEDCFASIIGKQFANGTSIYTWRTLPCDLKLPFICGPKHNQLVPAYASNDENLYCPLGYVLLGNKCFMLKSSPSDPVDWDSALNQCANSSPGASLASIDSIYIQDAITVIISKSAYPVWIGLISHDNKFQWVSRTNINYTNWYLGQPLVFNGSRCVMLHQRPQHLGEWEAVDCSLKLSYLCEIPAESLPSQSRRRNKLLNQGICKRDHYEYNYRCYHIGTAENTVPCEGRLAPYALDEVSFSRLIMHYNGKTSIDQAMIGVSLVPNSTLPSKLKYQTVDGHPYYSSAVINHFQIRNSPHQMCFAINRNDAQIYAVNCSVKLASICGYNLPQYNYPRIDGGLNISCPSGWIKFGTKCFLSVMGPPLSWSEAESKCANMDLTAYGSVGHLASIHYSNEQDFLGFLSGLNNTWIGLRMTREPISIHPNTSEYVSFRWSDESSADYLSFAPGNRLTTDTNEALERCFIQQNKSHDWIDVNCNEKFMFICEMRPSDTKEISKKYCANNLIDEDYCLMYIAKPATFMEADKICRNYAMTLATVPSEKHQNFIMNVLRNKLRVKSNETFIGLITQHGHSFWTSTYPSVPFTFWHSQVEISMDQCTYIKTNITMSENWDSISCDKALPYICSTDLAPKHVKLFRQNGTQQFYTCPAGFLLVGGSCYLMKAESSDKINWKGALQTCANTYKGAHLATIDSVQVLDSLTIQLGMKPTSVWIGLYKKDDIFHWSNGNKVTFTNWDYDQPSDVKESCALMHHELGRIGKWSDVSCDSLCGYICQIDPIITTNLSHNEPLLSPLLVQGHCQKGFYAYRDSCYILYVASAKHGRSSIDLRDTMSGRCALMTHSTGAECSRHYGTIYCPVPATPHSLLDVAFMRLLLFTFGRTSSSSWIGLKFSLANMTHDLISEDGSLVGLTELVDLGSVIKYKHQFNVTTNSTYMCMTLSRENDLLQFTNCMESNVPIICSYSLSNKTTYSPSTNSAPVPNLCPSEWISFNGNCYLYLPKSMQQDWFQAEQTCLKQGNLISSQIGSNNKFTAHLISIDSLDELHYIETNVLHDDVWLGLKIVVDTPQKRLRLRWTDQSLFNYSVASTLMQNIPINLNSSAQCITIGVRKNMWQLVDCAQPRNIVCKLSTRNMEPIHLTEMSAENLRKKYCTDSVSFYAKSTHSCYKLIQSNINWKQAETTCRQLDPAAHLASIHSPRELDELIDILFEILPAGGESWIGLYQSDFAYRWSDQSKLDYLPSALDLSKENRSYWQDCFTISFQPSTHFLASWKPVNCSRQIPTSVCQRRLKSIKENKIEPEPPVTPLLCPLGFISFGNRCFKLVQESLTWFKMNERCNELVSASPYYSGSLVRIDNAAEQQFLSSLLDNFEADTSSVWIGLLRNMSKTETRYEWSDKVEAKFIKPVLNAYTMPIYAANEDQSDALQCISLLRSTHPRENGIWLNWKCGTNPPSLPGICQAWPTTKSSNGQNLEISNSVQCPPKFHLSPTGQSSHLSNPVCYKLLSSSSQSDWESAVAGCEQLSTADYKISLISIASVYEASFLRAWLSQPIELHGVGLLPTEEIWTALRIPENCSNCYYNWTWKTADNEPVRYTDWVIPPLSKITGCYTFLTNPYERDSQFIDTGLGSLRPGSSCKSRHLAVCQTLAKTTMANRSHQPARPGCKDLPHEHENEIPHTSTTNQCIRWDLLYHNLVGNLKEIRQPMDAADSVGGNGTYSYAENYCAHYLNPFTNIYSFGCYISTNVTDFKECQLPPCSQTSALTIKSLHWFWKFCIYLVIALTVAFGIYLSWCGLNNLSKRRRRYFPFGQRRNSRKQMPSLYYGNPNATSTLDTGTPAGMVPIMFQAALTPTASSTAKDNFISLQSGGPRKLSGQVAQSDGGKLFVNNNLPLNGMGPVGFHNPTYMPLYDEGADDYDPEAPTA